MLFFDENLSPRLCDALRDLYPNSNHWRAANLASRSDQTVWDFAAVNGLTIVSKDDDFRQMSDLNGHPPKVILLRLGNCSTNHVELVLRFHHVRVSSFILDPSQSLLVIEPPMLFAP